MSSNIRIQRICQHCNVRFTAKTTVTKYCGDTCAKRAYKARKKKLKVIESDKETKQIAQTALVDLKTKEFLSVAETCQLFGVSRTSIWRMVKSGNVKTAKIGRRVIISKKEMQNLFR